MKTASGLFAIFIAGVFSASTVLAQTVAAPTANDVAQNTQDSGDGAQDGPRDGVRIVRLSQAHGKVLLDRDVHHGFEAAFANLPITQGATLKTEDGLAEVEFEDNSSLRLTPNSMVEFSQLARATDGSTASTVKVLHGTVYVSLSKSRDNAVTLTSSEGRITLSPASHVQFHVGLPGTSLSVMSGEAQAQVGPNVMTVTAKKSLLFNAANGNAATPTLVSHLEKNVFDNWDQNSTNYHKQFMNASSFGGSGLSGSTPRYGLSDLNYYGQFSDVGGCGSMWRPYFTSASWNPYGNGVWAQYQGGGYSWVSPYPWGWTPFHSGSWDYCPTAGWGWRPGNNWMGLKNGRMPVVPGKGPARLGPPHPPVKGGASLVAVNTQPLSLSKQSDAGTFVFAGNSAGMGVPRQTFGRLGGISSSVAQHGSFSLGSSFAGGSGGSSGFVAGAGASHSVSSSSVASSSFSGASHGSSGGGSSASGGGHR